MLSAAQAVAATVVTLSVGTLTGVAATCTYAGDLLGWGGDQFEVRFHDRLETIQADVVRSSRNTLVFEEDGRIVAVLPLNQVEYVARSGPDLEPGVRIVARQGEVYRIPGRELKPEAHNLLRVSDGNGETVGYVAIHRVQYAALLENVGEEGRPE